MKRLTSLFLTIIFIPFFSIHDAQGQNCSAEAEWTFDPPIADDMVLHTGTTVEICVDLEFYDGGGHSLLGMEFDFPEAWQLSTINIISAPQTCGSSGGEWIYADTLACGGSKSGSVGFYFDSNNDGSACNNYGNSCLPTGANQSFCIEVTLGSGTNGENIMPRLRLISDYSYSIPNNPCSDPIYVQPDFSTLILNCADIYAGVTPDPLIICESQCLFDLLEGAVEGGIWTGPNGYVDSSDCGYFDVDVNTLGDYTYTVSGNDCTSSSSISLLDNDLGVVATELICGDKDLDFYIEGEYPVDGIWTDPNGNILPNGMFIIDTMNAGLYNYEFSSESGCMWFLQIDVFLDPNVMLPVSTTYCGAEDFCLFDEFLSLQPDSGGYPTPGGNWLVYTEEGTYLEFIPEYNICFSAETMLNYATTFGLDIGTNLVFTYILGPFPCTTALIDFSVTIDMPITDFVFECVPPEVNDLTTYLPIDTDPGGVWTDSNGATTLSTIDFSVFDPGSVHNFYYNYIGESDCMSSVNLELTLLGLEAGSDHAFTLCANGEEIYLNSLLGSDASPNGSFNTASPYILANTSNNGNYTYTVTDTACEIQTEAIYTINFINQVSTAFEAICNSDGTTFNAYLEITGGLPPYQINGETFTSSSIELVNLPVNQTGQTILVEDSGPCGAMQINVSVPDSDGDGVCDSQEILGCVDPEASNYNPNATDPGNCLYTPGSPQDMLAEAGVPTVGKPGSGFGFGNELTGDLELTMSIFPNPATNHVSFDIKGLSSENSILKIRDIVGSEIYSENIASANGHLLKKIDIKGFSSGIYFVRLVNDGADVVNRLVISK